MSNGFTRDDQPYLTVDYNTDQFTDPKWGYTVHDDGSPTYTQPDTGVVYTKLRTYNGQTPRGYVSYEITLVPGGVPVAGFYVAEDGQTFYVDESGINFYVPVIGPLPPALELYVAEDGTTNYTDESGNLLAQSS